MKAKILFILLFISTYSVAGTINIAVAANLSYVMDTLKKEFNTLHPDTDIQVTLGSSGKLTAQIKNGAPYHIFMAADMSYPEVLYKDGLASTEPVIYAQGSLVYLSNKKQDFTTGMELLKSNAIVKIAIANPKTAPYGKTAVEAMKNAGVYDDVKSKYVFAESISQTVSYTITAADIGFIAKSSLYSPQMSHFKEGVNWADVESKLYTPINQGIVMLKNADKNAEVDAFYHFILSKQAQKIFRDFGYLLP